jgi:hypothetical protein
MVTLGTKTTDLSEARDCTSLERREKRDAYFLLQSLEHGMTW